VTILLLSILFASVAPAHAAEIQKDNMVLTSFRTDFPELTRRAVDGDPGTRWDTGRPQNGGEWYRIDMLRPVTLSGLELISSVPTDNPRRIEVHVAMDGKSFRKIADVEEKNVKALLKLKTSGPVCQIWLKQTAGDPVFYWSISELKVIGKLEKGRCPDSSAIKEEKARLAARKKVPQALPQGTNPIHPRVSSKDLNVSSFRVDNPSSAKLAIDDLPASSWHSGRPQMGGEWFQVEFPGPGELSRIQLEINNAPYDYPRTLQVSTSMDGKTFDQVAMVEGASPITEVNFNPPVSCAMLRLEQRDRDNAYFWGISDLRLWGKFPPRPLGLWERIPQLKAWIALIVLTLTAVGAFILDQRRKPTRGPG
jgi:hypothetical protein